VLVLLQQLPQVLVVLGLLQPPQHEQGLGEASGKALGVQQL